MSQNYSGFAEEVDPAAIIFVVCSILGSGGRSFYRLASFSNRRQTSACDFDVESARRPIGGRAKGKGGGGGGSGRCRYFIEYACMYMGIHIYACIHICLYTYMYIHIYTYICVYICMYLSIYIHI